MKNWTRQSALALGIVLLSVAPVRAEECEATKAAGSACPGSADSSSAPPTEEAAQGQSSYTWNELLEAIPELRKYELGFERSKEAEATEEDGTYVVCRKLGHAASRIKKRSCVPLQEYLAHVAAERERAEQYRLEFLHRRSTPPVSNVLEERGFP
ncbi:MAG: hypothetical protein AAFX85_06965 [Pseudomonadota bacterium]